MRRYKEDSKVNRLRKVLAVMAVGLAAGLILFSTVTGNNKKAGVSVYAGNAVDKMGLSEVRIEFIPGYDNPEGESSFQIITGTSGEGFAQIPYGEYTVRWQKNGYYDGYLNIEIKEEEFNLKKWMLPCAEGNSMYILAEWESEEDFDLCVFDEQSGNCIGKEAVLENAGSFLYEDNSGETGYELVYLEDGFAGSYTVYVKDCERIAENQENGRGERKPDSAGVTIEIYSAGGLLYGKVADGQAPLWKCASLSDGAVEEQDNCFYGLEKFAWAERDKNNPDSWMNGTSLKTEEISFYHADGEIYAIEQNKFHPDGNQTMYGYYDSDGRRTNAFEKEYDEDGCVLVEYHYDGRGELFLKWEYEYDENGNEIYRYTYYVEDGVEELYSKVENTYDEQGNQTASRRYDSDGVLLSGQNWIYGQNGTEIFCYSCDTDGKMVITMEDEYDADGRETASRRYGDNGLLEYKYEYEYDDEENRSYRYYYKGEVLKGIEESEYDETGNTRIYSSYDAEGVLKVRIEYDEQGNQTAVYECMDGIWYWRTRVSDRDGSMVEICSYEDEKLTEKNIIEYNERGEVVSNFHYNGDGKVKHKIECDYLHEYDAIGGTETVYFYRNGSLEKKTVNIYY